MTTTTATYLSVTHNLARTQATTAKHPDVKLASAYYAANIGKVKSIDQFVGNYRLLSYALNAYGLGDQINSKALIKQVLAGGVTNPRSLANSQPRWKAFAAAFSAIGQDPAAATATATAYYAANIGKVASIDQFVGDSKLLSYALNAYGLGDQAGSPAQVKKVLEGGVTDPKSLANTQTKWKAFATAFDFVGKGAASVSTAKAVAATEKSYATQKSASKAVAATQTNYVEQQLENDEGKQNVGVQLALYFDRVAPTVTSAYGILADKNLLEVVETIFGLPTSLSAGNIDTQARVLNGVFKIADLQDPAKLKHLVERFTAQYDSVYGPASGSTKSLTVAGASSSSSSSSSAGALAVLSGIVSANPADGAATFSNALLTSLQGFKIGG